MEPCFVVVASTSNTGSHSGKLRKDFESAILNVEAVAVINYQRLHNDYAQEETDMHAAAGKISQFDMCGNPTV